MNKRPDKVIHLLTWAVVGVTLTLSSLIIAMGIIGPPMLLLHAWLST